MSRNQSLVPRQKDVLFWSYYEAMSGNRALLKEIVLNILLFIPCGYLITSINSYKTKFVNFGSVFILSLAIEIVQLESNRGTFEYDDILNNSLGGFIGIGIYTVLSRTKYNFEFIYSLMAIIIMACVCFTLKVKTVDIEKEFEFQIKVQSNECIGFCFLYNDNADDCYDLWLKECSDSKELQRLDIEHFSRGTINDYFKSSYDYMNSCFKFNIEEYSDSIFEIIVDFKKAKKSLVSTGVYLNHGDIEYTLQDNLICNCLKNNLFEGGKLLYSNEVCSIYQKEKNLYWIYNKHYFNSDLRIQYQIWTTQPEMIELERRKKGYDWDNQLFLFSDKEIQDDTQYRCHYHRIAVNEINDSYPITAIVTGEYADEWKWRICLRPVIIDMIDF